MICITFTKINTTKKLRLTDYYQYPSEEETSGKLRKTDFDELNKQIIKEETEINKELFKNYFSFQNQLIC